MTDLAVQILSIAAMTYWYMGLIFDLSCRVLLRHGVERGDRYADMPDYWELKFADSTKRSIAWPYYLYVLAYRIKVDDSDV